MINPQFNKSVDLLSSPLSLIALVTLLINDHFLRLYFPSWLTGKIGDLAWLYFSPFVLAAILSLICPSSFRAKKIVIPAISFGSVLIVYTLANVSANINRSLVQFISNLLQMQFRITRDPTDLLALPSIGLALLKWIRFQPTQNRTYYPAFFLLSLSTLLTIANSGYPDYGIVCLEVADDRILAASSSWNVFASEDGGLTWSKFETQDEFQCDSISANTKEILSINDGEVIYKITEDAQIEFSRDGGQTWKLENDLQPMNQAEIAFSNRNNYFFYIPGPFAGVLDPNTGNAIIAMGVEGVLVHTPTDNWLSVPIDQYQRTNLTFGKIPSLIIFEMEIAFTFLLLVLIAPYLLFKSKTWLKVLLGLMFLACGLVVFYFKPALNAINYGAALIAPVVFILLLAAIIISAVFMIKNWKAIKNDLIFYSIFGMIGFIVFILPFLFWGMNIIASYNVSAVIAFVFTLLHLMGSLTFWGRRFDQSLGDIFQASS